MNKDRTFTIVPLPDMSAIQKNFAKLLKDGDVIAAKYGQKRKISLTDRFHLLERGFMFKMKEDHKKTMFDTVKVRFTVPEKLVNSPTKPKSKAHNKKGKKTPDLTEENKENIDSGRSSAITTPLPA